MSKKFLSANEALALGALRAGVKVVTGYPGTPSSEAIGYLIAHPEIWQGKGLHVEWSTNEKVALEIAAGAAWAGQRALTTMKMSGLNVAFDSLISIAYSGVIGGMIVYVADDPGASAGMAEQDSRGYAYMADLPMLEPASVKETYQLMEKAFDLSEKIGSPVFVRLTTAISQSYSTLDVSEPLYAPLEREPALIKDIQRFTKAGSAICTAQHRDLIERLKKAANLISEFGGNELHLGKPDGLGIITEGVTHAYLKEAFRSISSYGVKEEEISFLRVLSPNPFPEQEAEKLLHNCRKILVLEELEPYLEQNLRILAQRLRTNTEIIGKIEGPLSPIGEYSQKEVVLGLNALLEKKIEEKPSLQTRPEDQSAIRPITVCAGCPHRGTFLAINEAIRKAKLKREEVLVTGDIGCTILGMNPPFNTIWNEVAMGASIGIAMGYVQAGIKKPVIATIGDSTFFHAGLPPLISAIQQQVPLIIIIMDNGWTAMTGMQVNPGTDEKFQPQGGKRVDIAKLIPALGIENFWIVDPFDLQATTGTILEALKASGLSVILARRECAIQSLRRGEKAGKVKVIPSACNLCKICFALTGCPAISLGKEYILIDEDQCNGCGLCAQVCRYDAIQREVV